MNVNHLEKKSYNTANDRRKIGTQFTHKQLEVKTRWVSRVTYEPEYDLF